MAHDSESTVNQATINQRAEALEKKEAEAAEKAGKAGEEKTGEEGGDADAAAKAKADKEASDKAAADKAAADKKAAEEAEKNGQEKDPKTGKFVAKQKKDANDPDEMRKWATRTSQENSKLRKEMAEIKDAQEKTYKLLASLSKTPVDYKELAKKDPEALAKFIEDEKEGMVSEFQEQMDAMAADNKAKDIAIERMRRERDSENYPHWNRLYPNIVKLAMGPAGQGDPRVDFTKPAAEVLDQLYEIALNENPGESAPAKPTGDNGSKKTYKESELKAMVADMVSKEKEAIAKSAREEALREAQEALKHEAGGTTVASAGKGAGRIPTDQLAAFKKMSLDDQREWLKAQSPNQ